MIYFGIQLYETMITHKIFLFEVFIFYVWLVWTIKWISSRFYKKVDNVTIPNIKASVLVPVLNEKIDVFEKCLKSIIDNKADELIIIFDKLDNNPELVNIAHKYTQNIIHNNIAGKRDSLIKGMNEAVNPIIISADSDTIFCDNAIKNMLKPFNDKKVGGVTTRQHIFNPKSNIIRRFCDWMENIRFTISMPSQSVFGCIGCLPGRAIAFRKEVFDNNINEFLNETFMGAKCDSGDDRLITMFALKNNWKTVYQSDAHVYTDCPNNLRTFVKQQLRWARSSQRETIRALPWLWKKPYTFFCFITDIITPIFFIFVVVNILNDYLTNTNYFNISILIALPMMIIGMNVSIGFRQYTHLIQTKEDIIYLPLYTLFMTFIMVPIRIWGLLTLRNEKWMTRTNDTETV